MRERVSFQAVAGLWLSGNQPNETQFVPKVNLFLRGDSGSYVNASLSVPEVLGLILELRAQMDASEALVDAAERRRQEAIQ